MKPFRFSLQALLTLRQRHEHLALQEYGRAISLWQQALDRVNAAQQQCQAGCAQWQEEILSDANALRLSQIQAYCARVEELRREAECELAHAQQMVDQRRDHLVACRQEREAVDTYLKRQHETYDRELRREEQKLLDDMAIHRSLAAQWSLEPETCRN